MIAYLFVSEYFLLSNNCNCLASITFVILHLLNLHILKKFLMYYKDFIEILDKEFPPDSALEGDRIGLQVQSSVNDIRNVMVTYELTDEQIDEAETLSIDAVITFHPLIYRPLQTIIEEERVGRLTTRLIKKGIMCYTIHSNFDSHQNGTNFLIAQKLKLTNCRFLLPISGYENKGIGLIGFLPKKMHKYEFTALCHEVFGCPLKFSNNYIDWINSVAVVGGSGSTFITDVVKARADAFITGDLTYHIFHAYSAQLLLIDAGHYETEQFIRNSMFEQTRRLFKDYDLKVYCSKTYTNPIRYYPDTTNYIEKQINIYNINGKN